LANAKDKTVTALKFLLADQDRRRAAAILGGVKSQYFVAICKAPAAPAWLGLLSLQVQRA
jgi:ABC-type uncharacterized transport system permease subunit